MEAGMSVTRRLQLLGAAVILLSPTFARGDQMTKQQCISTNEEGQDLRRAGKLRTAADRFKACSSVGCPTALRADCSTRLEEVQRAMPTVRFEVRDGRGNTTTPDTIMMDGEPFVDHLDGTSLPVDPGKHRFVFKIKGSTSVERELTLREGVKDRLETVALPEERPKPDDAVADVQTTSSSTSTPTAAYVAFGVAVAGMAAGGVFTWLALKEKNKCPNDAGQTSCPNPNDNQENDAAVKRDSFVAVIGYGVGVVSGAVGLWLLLSNTPPKTETTRSPQSLRVQPLLGAQWIGLEGAF